MTEKVLFRCRKMFLMTFLVSVFGVVDSSNAADPVLELIKKIPHSGYSEGLDYHEGYLWHAIPKMILKIDPKDGSVVQRFTPATEYSESLTWFQGKLWNLSFKNNGIYSGDLQSGQELKFDKKGTTPEVHGWGLTHNGKELILTGDYSSKLYFKDPKTLNTVRTLETNAKDIEDLAWDGKVIWASSFTTERSKIFSIDPKSGKIIRMYKLPDELCPIVDGIAYDGVGLWITGKECPSIYYVKRP